MTRTEMNAKIADATSRWNERYADQIPNRYPGGYNPHDGADYTDVPEHHALISATPAEIGSLEAEIAQIMATYQSDSNPDRGR